MDFSDFFARTKAKGECDWVVLSSANQVAFFFVRASKFACLN
jgi:uroporphyrinogen-III synthase